jgi:hypothetical protein
MAATRSVGCTYGYSRLAPLGPHQKSCGMRNLLRTRHSEGNGFAPVSGVLNLNAETQVGARQPREQDTEGATKNLLCLRPSKSQHDN